MDNVRFKGARNAARIDQTVGDRIRKRRTLLGFTQEQLAEALDISYQQIQKYETGANRVSAGRLFQIAQRLEAPIGYFFEGMGLEFDTEVSIGSNRATIDLVRNFNTIGDPSIRNAVASLVKSLAQTNVVEDAMPSQIRTAHGGMGDNGGGENGMGHSGNGHDD